MDRMENGVEDRARCLWQEYQQIKGILKWQCHEIFDPRFFSSTIPPGPLIQGLKPFWILLRFRRDIIDFRTQKFTLKAARAVWIVRRPCMRCQWHILLSMTPHAFLIFFFAYHRCFAYDFHFSKLLENVNDTACISKNSNIFANSNLYSKSFSPLIRSSGRMFFENFVTLSL
jgi:hypothetical protein